MWNMDPHYKDRQVVIGFCTFVRVYPGAMLKNELQFQNKHYVNKFVHELCI